MVLWYLIKIFKGIQEQTISWLCDKAFEVEAQIKQDEQ